MKSASRIGLLACAISALAAMADAKELFKARLDGGQEVPLVLTDTTGNAFFRLDNVEQSIETQLHVNDGVDITQAHIHCAPAGVNGPVVVWLAGLNPTGQYVDGKWIGSATADTLAALNTACGATIAELADAMRNGDTYVNVHSASNPSGEIRGQIYPTR
jgi:hypothetical protein